MKAFLLSITGAIFLNASRAQQYKLASPDGKLELSVQVSKNITLAASLNGRSVLLPGAVSLTVNGTVLGNNPVVLRSKKQLVNDPFHAEVARKSKIVDNHYSKLSLTFRNNYSLIFRVYNDGLAYRFQTNFDKEILVDGENLDINFPEQTRVLFPEEESFLSDNERPYIENALTAFSGKQFCSLPMLATTKDAIRVLITDADLFDYPNMFLGATGNNSLKAIFPPVVLEAVPAARNGDRMETITKTAGYISKTAGRR